GDIFVAGNVRSGFKIVAGGSIWIKGETEGAEITAKNGNIEFRGGVLGKGKANIIAGGNISGDFIQDAVLRCNGHLFVKKSLLHVNADVAGDIVIKDKQNGLILGGILNSTGSVIAARIGNEKEVRTTIALRPQQKNSLKEKIVQLNQQKQEAKNLLLSIKAQIQTKKKLFQTAAIKKVKEKDDIERLLKAYYFAKQQIEKMEKSLVLMNAKDMEAISYGHVSVSDTLYTNNIFSFGQAEMKILAKRSACRLVFSNGEIIIEAEHGD
ncbi:MAG: DUF342 domain-containing protein, partial [Fibrobacteria bacterium]|nr:DUF342 domain-containing protein [Fibrobacteria bacterium]